MDRRAPPSPTAQELLLWQEEIRGIRPMTARTHHDAPASTAPARPARSAGPSLPPPGTASFAAFSHLAHSFQMPQEMDANLLRRIRLGRIPIERTLDLHGMTRETAHTAFCDFLARAYSEGCRLVLVITGKGSVRAEGVLKASLPRWCRESSLQPMIIGVHRAHIRHGGDGAFYVRIRHAV